MIIFIFVYILFQLYVCSYYINFYDDPDPDPDPDSDFDVVSDLVNASRSLRVIFFIEFVKVDFDIDIVPDPDPDSDPELCENEL